jgi:hypothetical protein
MTQPHSPTQATAAAMDAYSHLVAFLRSQTVPEEQKLRLLQALGRVVLNRSVVSSQPRMNMHANHACSIDQQQVPTPA